MKRSMLPFVTTLTLRCVQNAFAHLTRLSRTVYA